MSLEGDAETATRVAIAGPGSLLFKELSELLAASSALLDTDADSFRMWIEANNVRLAACNALRRLAPSQRAGK